MQRSLSLLRRIHGSKMVPINSFTRQHLLKPQYIAIRQYINPGGDYMELSETAWKEKRLYRYYKFSNLLPVSQQQRGYEQGIFVIIGYIVSFGVLYWIDVETCVGYRQFRAMREYTIRPWIRAAKENGYWFPENYSNDKLNEMYDVDLPAIAEKHDAPTKRTWKKEMCLAQCRKRDGEFDSPYHFEHVSHWMPTKAFPAHHKFVKEQEQGVVAE